MAAPVDAGRATTDGSSSSTSQTLNLPGSIAAGDLLVAIIRCPTNPTSISVTGFTSITALRGIDASDDSQQLFARTADGTEGATVSVTLGTAARMAGLCYRITGGDTVDVADSDLVSGTSSNPNGPNFAFGGTTTLDQHDTLYLSIGGIEGARTITSQPTNYSNQTIIANTGTTGNGQCSVYGASRGLTSSTSENPGAWTLSASDDWMIWTVAVYTANTHLLMTQEAVETLLTPDSAKVRMTQEAVEALITPTTAKGRMTQVAVEVLMTNVVVTGGARFRAYIID